MSRRPSEIKLVADLLADPDEIEVEDLAEIVIQALDRDRRKRDSYVVKIALREDDEVVWGLGPYPTRGEAEKVAQALRPDLPADTVKGAVVKLIRPEIVETDLAQNIGTFCIACRHPMVAHDWPKSKIQGCVVAGCTCGKTIAQAA